MGGHSNTVGSIQSQTSDPQVLTGSHDSTIRLWDLVAGDDIFSIFIAHMEKVFNVVAS